MAWVNDFFTKNPNLKQSRKKSIFFSVLSGRIRVFVLQRIQSKHFFFFFFFGGGGLEGLVIARN